MTLPDDYYVDFGEITYPMSVDQELKMLQWKLDNGIMTKRDLLLYFNPDMNDQELEEKLGEVAEERNQEVQQQREAQEPVSQIERILNAG